jgi:NAD(P)H-flavin reductase
MVPMPFRVRHVRRETHDTYTLQLEPPDRDFAFAPGQFNMLYIYGVGEVPISISGDPQEPERLVHTVRTVGLTTRAICQSRRGQILGIRGPFGSPWPLEAAVGNDVVLVTGGIGLAPLRPVLYHLLAHREKYGKLVLLYGARTPRDLLYRRELERWLSRFDVDVHVTVDHAQTEEWRGHVGVVTKLIPRAAFDPFQSTAMICGPEIMMRFTVLELGKLGVPVESMYISMERNMKCAVGFCGHCQYGPTFICKDGPVFRLDAVQQIFGKREI